MVSNLCESRSGKSNHQNEQRRQPKSYDEGAPIATPLVPMESRGDGLSTGTLGWAVGPKLIKCKRPVQWQGYCVRIAVVVALFRE